MTHRVLILCTGNSVRSQMAEGLLRHLGGSAYEVRSAGTYSTTVSPLAIEVMREIGIDISAHRSKPVTEFAQQRFDTVITVCDSAAKHCPVFPGAPQRIHWSISDPGAVTGSHEEKLAAFRLIRDDLASRLRGFLSPPPAPV
jgi:arsenate reductase (thioredoxin)